MLGIRLSREEEERLARYARESGRAKSAVARQWIVERMDREAVDQLIRNAEMLDADERAKITRIAADDASSAWMRWLDAEDGGYDWGPEGPPV
jgi:predicted DNA-binding protein